MLRTRGGRNRGAGAVPLVGVLAAILVLPTVARAAEALPEPWVGAKAFGVSPKKLVAAAAAYPAPADAPVLELFEDHRFTYDATGRSASSHLLIYKVLKTEGLGEWATILKVYDPWYESKPEIRARVVTPDGVSHPVAEASLAESPFGATQPRIFSERRVVTGPLPALVPGSVVEVESIRQETAPLFDAGTVQQIVLRREVPVRRIRVSVDAPASLPLRHAVRGVDGIDVQELSKGDRVELKLDAGPFEAVVNPPSLAPPDTVTYPYFAWSTGASWGEVAARYSAVVDRQIGKPDLRSIVEDARPGVADPAATVAALVARLHREVRYTGVEFREAGIVPRRPTETLERKYGDCKDMATLLVGMLRTAGFRAHVVLVAAGLGSDPAEDLPGLGPFNHAIVRVDDPPLWVDPTDEYARPGVLSFGVAGRLCLVARPGVEGLERLPEGGPDDNRVEFDREVFLAAEGPARISQSIRSWGLSERNQRQRFAGADPGKARDAYADIMKQIFGAKNEPVVETSDVHDFSAPFRVGVEVEQASLATTTGGSAAVAIGLEEMLGFLTSILPPKPSRSAATPEAPRSVDVKLPWPMRVIWRYRIHPPPGYMLAQAPVPIDEALGPATLRLTSSTDPDGTAKVELVVDSGPSRWTAAEWKAALEKADTLGQRKTVTILFHQATSTYLAESRVGDALRELREQTRLHPDVSAYRLQRAEALLAAGLGDASREAAREAVTLDSKSAAAQRTLGETLLHDSFGRAGKPGFDLRGAESAMRRAVEIDPSSVPSRRSLARTLELDEHGLRYGPEAKLGDAIEQYRAIRDELHSGAADDDFLAALFYASRMDDVASRARTFAPSPRRNALWVAALAAAGPLEDALAQATRVAGSEDERRSVLLFASLDLMATRRWPQAAALMTEAFRGDSSNRDALRFVDLVRTTKRAEDVPLQGEAVRSVARFIEAVFGGGGASAVAEAAAPSPRRPFDDFRVSLARATLGGDAPDLAEETKVPLPPSTYADFIVSSTEFTSEEGGEGHRVRLSAPKLHGDVSSVVFTVSTEVGERVLAVASEPEILGEEALRRLASGDTRGAAQWLRWAAELVSIRGDGDPLSVPPFLLFWGAHPPSDAQHLRCAAAALATQGHGAAVALPILEAGLAQASLQQEKFNFDRALLQAYAQLKRWDRLVPVARRVRGMLADSHRAFLVEAEGLAKTGRWEDVDALVQEATAAHVDEATIREIRVDAADLRERWSTVTALLRPEVEKKTANGWGLNLFAWSRLMEGQATDEALDAARRAVDSTGGTSSSYLHTLAALEAEAGHPDDARETLAKELDALKFGEPGAKEMYVLGRIAEGYGEIEAAEAAYHRVTDGPGDLDDRDCRALARRRLAAVEAGKRRDASGESAPAAP